jgi:AraC-like DNA-binding protein
MGAMEPIALIHRSALTPAIAILDEFGAPTSSLLRRHRLPSIDLDDPKGFIPLIEVWEFLSTSATSEGLWDLGFRIAERVRIERAGRWGPRVARAPTFMDAVRIMSECIRDDMPNVHVGLELRGSRWWLWRDHIPDRRRMPGYCQGEQFILGLMLQLVKMVGGSDWYPEHIEVQASASEWDSRRPEGIGSAHIEFDAPRTGVEVPSRVVTGSLHQPAQDLHWSPLTDSSCPPTDLTGSLRAVLRSLLFFEERPNLQVGADLLRTSERTLRRHLASEGQSWRRILDDVEAERAIELIEGSDEALADIARRLGYSQYAHFNRAFHRWTGASPSAYRSHARSA